MPEQAVRHGLLLRTSPRRVTALDKQRETERLMITGDIIGRRDDGVVEGWAADLDALAEPVEIRISQDDVVIGSGFAQSYLPDLLRHGAPHCWCGFVILVALQRPVSTKFPLKLRGGEHGDILSSIADCRILDHSTCAYTSVEDVIFHDPTSVRDVEELRSCSELFTQFAHKHGFEEFVSTAYVYILGRPVDPGGLRNYAQQLVDKHLDPFAFLQILASSPEFLSKPRLLVSPASHGFPFR